jgi:hypothetical protein
MALAATLTPDPDEPNPETCPWERIEGAPPTIRIQAPGRVLKPGEILEELRRLQAGGS